ncbi:MAG: GreA/GreB family elongation factor [Deltaproteobacteria bacterium]|nr:GreA/GreB family elongation factor [Deltaproteobacteria bacterium]
MDKQFLVEQLTSRLRESVSVARKAGQAAEEEARDGATASEKRENARVSMEYSGLARGQKDRANRTIAELATLETFRPPARLPARGPVSIGAIVEVEMEDDETKESQGRTFFLAPVGAGIELTGPGGDGFLSVVTPISPVGKAVLGKRLGDTIEVIVEGEPREWTITFVE